MNNSPKGTYAISCSYVGQPCPHIVFLQRKQVCQNGTGTFRGDVQKGGCV